MTEYDVKRWRNIILTAAALIACLLLSLKVL